MLKLKHHQVVVEQEIDQNALFPSIHQHNKDHPQSTRGAC